MQTVVLFRMVPLFIVLMLFMINIFPYLGDGPWWNYHAQFEVENCRETFWNHVFAFGNIVNPEKMVKFWIYFENTCRNLSGVDSEINLGGEKSEKLQNLVKRTS